MPNERINRETVDFHEFKGHRFSNWYKAIVPKSRIGMERRLSRTGTSEMALPAKPMEDMADPALLSTSPKRKTSGPMRRLSTDMSGEAEGLHNFMKRDTGDHYFYKPALNFLDGQGAAVYEFQLREPGKSPYTVYIGSTCRERGDTSPRQRIQIYLQNGGRKAEMIEEALNNGMELWIRISQDTKGMDQANQIEDEMLDKYEYAWNARRNWGVRRIEHLPEDRITF